MEEFTWVSFYKELAQKLIEYENRQKDLIDLLAKLNKQGIPTISLKDKDANNNTIPLREIDPFSFYASFNRGVTDQNRKAILQEIKIEFHIESDVPKDFSGIPVVDNRKSWFFTWEKNRGANDIQMLWELFIQAVRSVNDVSASIFDKVLNIIGVSITNLSMGLFWVNMDSFTNCDGRMREYFGNHEYHFPKIKNLTDYKAHLESLSELFPGKSFYELSFDAWKETSEKVDEPLPIYATNQNLNKDVSYWLFQGNPKVFDLELSLKQQDLCDWTVSAHKDKIKVGDKVILWMTGNKAGCYALAEVTSAPYAETSSTVDPLWKAENKIVLKADIKITYNFVDKPILKQQIEAIEELKKLKIGFQGTNFAATEEEFSAFLKIAEKKNSNNEIDEVYFINRLKKSSYKNNKLFFDSIDKLINDLQIPKGDNLIFSTSQKQLSFHVGSRYCLALSKDKFGFISSEKLQFEGVDEGNFEGEPIAFWYRKTNGEKLNKYFGKIAEAVQNELYRGHAAKNESYKNAAFENAVFDKAYRNKIFDLIFDNKPLEKQNDMNSPLNTILYGPPGTGKTYRTVNKALEIIHGENYLKNKTRAELITEFNRLKGEGKIDFVSFHQSFTYEDFIEGIKPKLMDDNDLEEASIGDLRYEIRDGVFKRISKRAAGVTKKTHIITEKTDFENVDFFKMSLGGKNRPKVHDWCINNNRVGLGWGGDKDFSNLSQYVGNWNLFLSKSKSLYPDLYEGSKYTFQAVHIFMRMKKGDIVLVSKGNKIIDAIGVIASDKYIYENLPDIEYCQFREVKWLGTNLDASPELFVNKNISQQSIYEFYGKDINRSFFIKKFSPTENNVANDNYVIVIDEINRGNVSAIFGELITLIEADKRLGAENELTVTLPYSGNEEVPFGVPSNLHIIGTMNTADRSVEALDTALRRRFSFVEMAPQPELIKTVGKSKGKVEDFNLVKMLETINNRIEKLIDKDHMIGHSYFLSVKTIDELKAVFQHKIIPLLQEYFFGDYGKIGLVLGSGFFEKEGKQEKNEEKIFASFNGYDVDLLTEKPIYHIKNVLKMDDFEGALKTLMGDA